ncbi:MAG: hypothetical protein HOP19_00115 [Acidobacteria bacterium]|nr:hypothetical protein [Acidobacteriota bacterium]
MTVFRQLQPGYADFLQNRLHPARQRGGVKNLYIWSTALGDLNELVTLQPIATADSFYQLDAPQREPAAAVLWQRFERFYEERLDYVIVTRPELSAQLLPAPNWPRLVRLRITTTAPQREGEFKQWLQRELLPHATRYKAATEWLTTLRYGGDVNNTFLSWRMSESFADLDAAFDRQANAQLVAAGIVTCDTDYWLRYRPDLSIVTGKAATEMK